MSQSETYNHEEKEILDFWLLCVADHRHLEEVLFICHLYAQDLCLQLSFSVN